MKYCVVRALSSVVRSMFLRLNLVLGCRLAALWMFAGKSDRSY